MNSIEGDRVPRGRGIRWLTITASTLIVVVVPQPAQATTEGPCEVSIDGRSVAEGYDSPSTALRVGGSEVLRIEGFAGPADARAQVADVAYRVRFLGLTLHTSDEDAILPDGAGWSTSFRLGDVSWVASGLALVQADARTSAGGCRTTAFVCVTGRSPFTTVAGLAGMGFVVGGILVGALSISRIRRDLLVRAAFQSFLAIAMIALGLALIAQQSCVALLDAASAVVVPLTAGLLGTVVAFAVWTVTGRRGTGSAGAGTTPTVPLAVVAGLLAVGALATLAVTAGRSGDRAVTDLPAALGSPIPTLPTPSPSPVRPPRTSSLPDFEDDFAPVDIRFAEIRVLGDEMTLSFDTYGQAILNNSFSRWEFDTDGDIENHCEGYEVFVQTDVHGTNVGRLLGPGCRERIVASIERVLTPRGASVTISTDVFDSREVSWRMFTQRVGVNFGTDWLFDTKTLPEHFSF